MLKLYKVRSFPQQGVVGGLLEVVHGGVGHWGDKKLCVVVGVVVDVPCKREVVIEIEVVTGEVKGFEKQKNL